MIEPATADQIEKIHQMLQKVIEEKINSDTINQKTAKIILRRRDFVKGEISEVIEYLLLEISPRVTRRHTPKTKEVDVGLESLAMG